MTITRDVVRDLLPVYAAGEASADTRALVEEFLAHDHELRALVETARTAEVPRMPSPDYLEALELKSLDRTRSLLSRKAWLLAASLFFSLLPLSFMLKNGRIVFLLAREQPVLSAISMVLGLIAWIAFFDVCRLLSATGFEPPHTFVARVPLLVASFLVAASLVEVLKNWTGGRWLWLLFPLFLGLFDWFGMRWRIIPNMNQIHQPTSLFNGDSNPPDKHRD